MIENVILFLIGVMLVISVVGYLFLIVAIWCLMYVSHETIERWKK